MPWKPQSHSDWARFLGLVATPLFGEDRRATLAGKHFVLLDGHFLAWCFHRETSPTYSDLRCWPSGHGPQM